MALEINQNTSTLTIDNSSSSVTLSQSTPSLTVTTGGALTTFTSLSDTPNSLTGQSLKGIRVKSDETGLEFFTGSGLIEWGEIGGTLSDQTDLNTALGLKYDAADFNTDFDTRFGNTSIGSLSDVDLTGISNDKILQYNSTSSNWEIVDIPAGVSFGTDNQIPYVNSDDNDFDYSANLTFDGSTLLITGDVGVGTSTPLRKVNIYENSSSVNGQFRVENDGVGDAGIVFALTGIIGYSIGIDNSDDDKFKIGVDSSDIGNSNILTIDSVGLVGMHNQSPTQPLHVIGQGVNLGVIRMDNTGAGAGLVANRTDGKAGIIQANPSGAVFAYDDTGSFIIVPRPNSEVLTGTFTGLSTAVMEVDSNDNIRLGADANNYIFIDDGGGVGLGSNLPKRRLHITDGSTSGLQVDQSGGQIALSDNAIPRIYFEDTGETTGNKVMGLHYANQKMWFGSLNDAITGWDVQNILVMGRDGNVGIGTEDFVSSSVLTISGNSYLKTTGSPAVVTTDRTDGKISALSSGSLASGFRFDNSGDFIIQSQPRANLEAQDGNNLINIMTIDGGAPLDTFVVDSSGNIGIGTSDIENWDSAFGAVEFFRSALFYSKTSEQFQFTSNAYYDGAYKYKANGEASRYMLNNGNHIFDVASSGVANNTFTWSEVFRVANDGNVGINSASPNERLEVNIGSPSDSSVGIRLSSGDYMDNQHSQGIDWWVTDSDNKVASIRTDATNTNWAGLVLETYDGTAHTGIYIADDGNVGLGGTFDSVSQPTEVLQVDGNIFQADNNKHIFGSSKDVEFYFDGTDQILDTGGAEVHLNGNLLIGNGGDFTNNAFITDAILKLSAAHSGVSGLAFRNTGTGISSDIRFSLENNQGDYLAPFMPASTNTGSLFGETRGDIAGMFLNATTDTDKKMVLGTVNAGSLILGTNGTQRLGINSAGGTVWNEGGESVVFRFEGDTDQNLLYLNGSTDRVGIGVSSPDTKLDVNGAITFRELSADPSDPDEGATVLWQSDGTGTGSDGDVLAKVTAGATTKTYDAFGTLMAVWAEENGSLSTAVSSGFQFSFGNGAVNSSGIVIPYDGVVEKLSICSQTSTTGTVELYKNGSATGATVSLSAGTTGTNTASVSISSGDRITFKTTSGSGGTVNVVGAFIRAKVEV